MYKVIHEFLDLQDGKHHYKVGDTYPRRGKKIIPDRIEELSGRHNKIGKQLIEEVVKEKTKKKEVK